MFVCEKCRFQCIKRSNYTAHLKTKKHITVQPTIITVNNTVFVCEKCAKQYKTYSGLWKHQNACIVKMPVSDEMETISTDSRISKFAGEATEEFTPYMNTIPREPTTEMLNMIYDLVKQNQEIKEMLMKQTEQIREYTANPQPVIIHQNIQHNTTNNISLNVFLQEKCKGAINMSDFLNRLDIDMTDLEMVGKIGFVEGISRIIMNGLSRMDIYTRPIHCTDTKRETIYIKDRDKWMRDTETKENTKKVIETVANKNLNKIPEWRIQNPGAEIMDSNEHNLNMSIMIHSLGGLGGTTTDKRNRNHDKIIKIVSKEITLNKEYMLES